MGMPKLDAKKEARAIELFTAREQHQRTPRAGCFAGAARRFVEGWLCHAP